MKGSTTNCEGVAKIHEEETAWQSHSGNSSAAAGDERDTGFEESGDSGVETIDMQISRTLEQLLTNNHQLLTAWVCIKIQSRAACAGK